MTGAGYDAALAATDPDPALDQTVLGTQAAILARVRQVLDDQGLGEALGVVRVMNVGSTSRGFYLGPAPDFDPVVETRASQADIGHGLLEDAAGRMARALEADADVRAYLARAGADAPSLEAASIGPRGKESFVARYEVAVAGERRHVLDITFGRLPQLTGYEIWMQRHLAGLDAGARLALQREVRLAKSVLGALPGLYGSAAQGFRAHLVEQWIIQASGHRPAQHPSFDNALRLVDEQSGLGFAAYRQRFPVWHPGWWEPEVGLGPDRPGVNLLDLLGDGDEAPAWPRLTALARAHAALMDQGRWSIPALLAAARDAASA